MKKGIPWVVAVIVGYIALVAVVLYVLPTPWNYVATALIGLMAIRFVFTIRAASRLGTGKRSAPK